MKNPNLLVCRLNSPPIDQNILILACVNNRLSSLLAAGGVSRNLLSGEERGETAVFCRLEEYYFLAIPPHSQLIYNHDTEVYVPIASCPLWCILGTSSGRIGLRRKIVSQFLPMVLRCERFARARAPLSFKVSLNTIGDSGGFCKSQESCKKTIT